MPLTAGSQQKDYHSLTGSEPDADWWISPQDANEGTPANAVIATQLSDLYKSAYKAATEKTVSGGVLTVDQSSHTIQPETGTSDDINTISGMKADTFLVLYVTDEGTDTLTFKHGTGNLSCFGAADVALSHGMVVCYYDGSVVYVAGGGAGGGGGQARKSLPITAAHLPDDSSGSAAAQINSKVTSSGTDPQPRWIEALFDASTDEHIYFQFLMPDNYSSAPVIDVYYKCASATSGTVAFGAQIFALSGGDATDMDAKTFDSANVGTDTVPGTAGHLDIVSITMTNADSVSANDIVVLGVFRDVSGDSVSGDIEVPLVVLRYTST